MVKIVFDCYKKIFLENDMQLHQQIGGTPPCAWRGAKTILLVTDKIATVQLHQQGHIGRGTGTKNIDVHGDRICIAEENRLNNSI